MDCNSKKDVSYVSYVTFLIGFDFIRRMIGDEIVDSDSVYDYSEGLAREFVGSKYDDEVISVKECVYSFIVDKMPDIKGWFADTQGVCDIKDPILEE